MHTDTVKHGYSGLSSYAENSSVMYMYACADFYSILEDFVHRCVLRGAVFLEKPLHPQVVKKFPEFYGTWRFITMLKPSCHLSISWAR